MQLFESLEYAGQGWPVIPLHGINSGRCTCSKPDCKSPGKHPRTRNGLKDASLNKEQIVHWFDKWENANVGILTGSQSGFIAVDIDPAHGGEDSFHNLLVNAGGELPSTVEQETGSGGRHLLFKNPGIKIPNSAGKLGPGIDIRGENGYIVAPPSAHTLGQYKWLQAPSEIPLATVPDWLLNMLLNGSQKLSEPHTGQFIQKGKRNTHLTSIAGRLRRQGKGKKNIEAHILVENERVCLPPLSKTEVTQIASSVTKYGTSPLHNWRDLVRSEYGPENPRTRHLLINLSFYFDVYGSGSFPSMERQAVETGLSRRTVQRLIRSAADQQWLYIHQRKGTGQKWRHYAYNFRIPDKLASQCHHLITEGGVIEC